jgi:uncharacterized membrane protein YcfT
MTMRANATSSRERLQWADLAKGICMLLVVLVHVHHFHYMQLDWVTTVPVRRGWIELNDALTPLRMPVFFAISGLFAAAALRRPWRQVVTRRLTSPVYLYVVWTALTAGLYAALGTEHGDLVVTGAGDFVRQLIVPTSTLWYLYALALSFVAAKSLRKAPVWAVMFGAGAVSAIANSEMLNLPGMWDSVLRNMVFFLAGACLPRWVHHAAGTSHRLLVILTGSALIAVTSLLDLSNRFGIDVLAGLLSIGIGVAAATLLTRTPVARVGAFVGRNTLPLFILHLPLIVVLHLWSISGGQRLYRPLLDSDLAAGLYPLAATAAVSAVCLMLHAALMRLGATWLFSVPQYREALRTPGGPAPSTAGPLPIHATDRTAAPSAVHAVRRSRPDVS